MDMEWAQIWDKKGQRISRSTSFLNGLFAISYAFTGDKTVATESRYERDAGSITFVLLYTPRPPSLLVVVLVLDRSRYGRDTGG